MTSLADRKTLDCRNCGAHAPEEYCPRCGQETSEHLPSAKEFLHEFVLHYFAAEGRLWRTLRALMFHPGLLTLEYLRGRKLAYVLPLRLYLTISLIFFLVLRLATAPDVQRVNAKLHESLNEGTSNFTISDLPHATAILNADGSFICDMPRWLCGRIEEHVRVRTELEKRYEDATGVLGHMPTAMFVLLPLFAVLLKLVFVRRSYGEHFLFALHVHSFWFLLLLLTLLPLPLWVQRLLQAYMVIYSAAALHMVYRAGWLQTALKAMFVGSAYALSLLAAMALLALGAFVV